MKDLETKVTALNKAKEADQHENGMLKAQVERLQVELREYRKRLSLNGGSGANRSPPTTGYGAQQRSNSNPSGYSNNFQFEFPKFGALPGSQIFGNQGMNNSNPALVPRGSLTPPVSQSPTNGSFSNTSQQNQVSRQNSQGRSMSPQSINGASNVASPSQMTNVDPTFAAYSTNDNMHGFASTLPQMGSTSNDPFGDLFSPSLLKSASVDNQSNYFGNGSQMNVPLNPNNLNDINGGDSTAGLGNRAFQFNGNSSVSDSASPSASSNSQWNGNANSSCGTSPEPSHGSPANQTKNGDTFYDKYNPTKLQSPLSTNNQTLLNNTDYSVPSLDSFDPVLFGGYRDSQDAVLGSGDFTGGFFDEALNAPFDYGSPSNLFGILQSPQPVNDTLSVPSAGTGAVNAPTPSSNLMEQMDKMREEGGDDYNIAGVKAAKYDSSGKMISCNNIW